MHYKTLVYSNSTGDSEARDVVRFCTGAPSILPNRPAIEVVVNKSPTESSPMAQTCNCTLLLPSTYEHYSDFRKNILERIQSSLNHFGMA